jgi:hypothetical protein
MPLDRKSMGHTVAERSWKDADFCVFLYLAWRLWKSVVTFAVTRNTSSGRLFGVKIRCLSEHRLPLTGSRWDIRWLSGRGKTPTFCVFPVFSVAVMEKCCDACGDGEYYFRSSFSASQGAVSQRHRLPLTGSRWDIRWLSGRGKTPTFCVFPVFSVAVMEKCCDACGDGEYYFRSRFLASQGAVSERHRLPLTGG